MTNETKASKITSLSLVLPVVALTVAVPLLATPSSDVAARVQGYRALGDAYKTASDGLRRGSPDIKAMRSAAKTISSSARQQFGWYPASSAPQRGIKTAAKPEIWKNPTAFRAAQDKFAAKAVAFEKAVATGDVAAMRSASRLLGASCKGCHDDFRVERD
jgi:cytochrome c556